MKQNKAILVFGILLTFILIMINTNVSKATEGETKDLYIVNHSSNGAYSITVDEGYLEIWKIIEKTNNYNNNIYCIKGGPGFGSNEDDTNPIKAKNYTWRSNFKDVSATLSSSIVSLPKNENVTGIQIKNGDSYQTVTYNNYNAILWLIDNMYIPKLTKLSRSSDSGINIPNTIKEMKANLFRAAFSDYINSNLTDDQVISTIGLSDDDIEVIQQLALWHFTNTKNSTNETYKKFDVVSYDNGQIQYRTRIYNGNNAQVIKINSIMLNGTSFDNNGLSKQTSAEILFTYLVHNAMLNAIDYGTSLEEPRDLTGINPLVFTGTTLEAENSNGKTIIGPFRINEQVSNKEFELSVPEIKDKNNSNNKINSYTIYTLNESNQRVQFATNQTITPNMMKSLVGKDFYVEVSENEDLTEKVFSVDVKYLTTTADFWMVSGSNGSAEQPVIIVDKDYKSNPIEKEINFSKSIFDLALRKFITAVNGTELKTGNRYTREPVPEYVENYKNTGVGRFIYKHIKNERPVEVEFGDIVTYTLRIYNEGNVDGYAKSIIDDIPEGLEYIGPIKYREGIQVNTVELSNAEQEVYNFNSTNGWSYSEEGKKLTTDYLSKAKNQTDNLIEAYNSKSMTSPKYKDVQIQFRVKGTNLPNNRILINTAEINDAEDTNGNSIKEGTLQDIDSIPGNNKTEEEDSNHNFKEDDIDKEYLKVKTFDLALRKFITSVNGVELKTGNKYTREPVVAINSQTKKITYTHPKTPVMVKNGDIVVYTIRIYNEGQTDGYAEKVTDYLPEGTKFIETNQTNIDYRWELDASDSTGRTISTKYLSKERDNIENDSNGNSKTTLLKAFDGTDVDYIDLKIAVEVTEQNDTTKAYLENIAEITDDRDKNGNKVDDIDSTPENMDKDTRNQDGSFGEDDTDFERIKLQIFDMALREFITAVNGVEIKDGDKYDREPAPVWTENYLNTGINRFVYKHKKDESPVRVATGDLVTYTLRLYNEGTIDGYVQLINADIPDGLEYVPNHETNIYYEWTQVDGRLTTNWLSYEKAVDNVIRAFDKNTMMSSGPNYKDVKIVFKVTEPNSSTRMIAHTSEIADEADTNGNKVSIGTLEDIDSIPGNSNEKGKDADHNFTEDDIDKDYIVLRQFDLALRKFITAVNGVELKTGDKYTREPIPVWTENYLSTGKSRFVYKHKKNEDPVRVATGDLVTYTIRIYNEGDINGYAQEIVDDIPSGLEFLLDNETNKLYGWIKTGNTVKTDYLSSEKAVGNVINAYNKNTMSNGPEYKDVKITFKVIEENNSAKMIVNTAEISDESDTNGNSTSKNTLNDIDSTPGNGNESGKDTYHNFTEDDIDKDYIILRQFDLALRKFITAVNENELKNGNNYDREPVPEYVSNYKNTGKGRFVYKHKKDEAPVSVQSGNVVTYTIRIYNEGDIDGYAQEIVDDIPEGLEFLPDNATNKLYGWVKTGNKVKTDYLSLEKSTANVIQAFNSSSMSTPAYKDVKIAFKVVEDNNSSKMIANTAEISDESDANGNSTSKNTLKDIDSTPGNGNEDGKDENHNFKEDDIDKDYIVLQKFDLALRKFITAVNGKEITTRIPEVTINESGKITYIHPKEPILVANGNLITYTIRVYNEGDVDGYAQEIIDNVPEGLEFLPDNDLNKYYGWKLDNGKIKTNYLSRQKAIGNLIRAFDRNTKNTPDYKDVKVIFKVTDKKLPDNKILINTAEISEDADKDGNPIEDVDSIPGNDNDEGEDANHNFKEDDIDKEYVKVQYFDLALLKWVTKVITTVDGETSERETGHQPVRGEEKVVKQEINRKKMNETTVKFEYTIRVINEGQIAGYAKEISDYIPEGLKFVKEDNPAWNEQDGKVTTRILENILLQPGQSADIKIILTWINDSNNMGTKINTAEISEDDNDYDAPDIDSTPNNKIPNEDDIDDAPVALSTSTGEGKVVYFGLGSLVLAILIGGIFIIRKYVV